ncbi:MAG TPA: hypothetical protein VK887_12300, partial [Pseudonocardiaceae bacterium]|nr:hypothetical protein [Pseudonocardiaceae bacterium]
QGGGTRAEGGDPAVVLEPGQRADAGYRTGGDHFGHRTEGVLTDRVVGTYLHGPVLARNPALADHILHKITGQPLPPLDLPDQAAFRLTYLHNRT